MGASSQEVMKSAEEIEEGISSTQTVTWDPFTVFPKEIYVKIFDKLDNPVDKMNFMNAHVKWYELFKDKRTLFLFQDVFKKVYQICSRFGENRDWFDLRLVCSTWDKAVQKSFQLSPSNFLLSYAGHRIGFENALGMDNPSFYMVDAAKLENDLRKFSVTHPSTRNPFLSRKLYLEPWGPEEEDGRYQAAVEALLRKYGRHIWYFKISTNLEPQTCRQIAKWLRLMPELKTLEVENDKRLSQLELEEIRDMELAQTELNELVVLESNCLPSVVFNKVFGDLGEMERIQIWLPRRNESYLRDYELPINRESLKEAGFKSTDLVDIFEYFNRGEPFPNLRALAINEDFKLDENETEWLEWRKAFEILEEKFPALEEFLLDLPKAVMDVDKEVAINQSLEASLNLPKLKKLLISLPSLASIDFLLPCKALEELSVTLKNDNLMSEDWADVGRREKLKFNVDLSTLWKSNIWDELPKLKELEVNLSCKRGGHHFYRYRKAGEERKYSARFDSEIESSDDSDYDFIYDSSIEF